MSFTDIQNSTQPLKRSEMTPASNPTAMEATLGVTPEVPKRKPDAPRRPDVLGSAKWHDSALEAYQDNRFFSSAKMDHLSITNSLDALDHINSTRDPRVTEAAHAERLTKQAEQAARRIEERIKGTLERSAEAIRNHKAVMEDSLKVSQDSGHGREIRERLARMSDDDRRLAINKAAQEGDHHVMSAVLHGPGFLTGISEDEKGKFKDSYARRHAPQMVAELEAVKRSAEKLENAHFEAVDHIRRNYVNRSADPAISQADEAQRIYDSTLRSL